MRYSPRVGARTPMGMSWPDRVALRLAGYVTDELTLTQKGLDRRAELIEQVLGAL